MNTRDVALRVLYDVEHNGAYSALSLNRAIKENKLRGVDASFASALVYGVLERQLTLDYIISQYSKIPLKKIELKTRLILRLGILQLVFMDKVPQSAAVNESVSLAKKHGLQRSGGFINGVLRNIARADCAYNLSDVGDKEKYLSIKYSCPGEIVNLWLNAYGGEICEDILKTLCGRPPLTARVNTLKTTPQQLIKRLGEENIKARESEMDENALVLENTGSIENIKAYREGLFYIQDISSQLCVKALNPKPHQVVLDVCSAPGGKAFTAAQYMKNRGEIYAYDIHGHKLRLIEKTARRLGITCIRTGVRDAENDTSQLLYSERVLCDVPCSGLGILSRKPEIRYKKDLLSPKLSEAQYRILCNSSRYTASGGVLVYSTCTLNPRENGENVKRFLEEHRDFEPLPLRLGVPRLIEEDSNTLTLFPHFHGADGFFISAFRKIR